MTAQSVKTQPMELTRVATNNKIKASPNRAGFDQVMDKNLKTTVVDKDKPITRQKTFMTKVKEVVEKVIREQSKANSDINSETIFKAEELGLVVDVISEKDILFDENDDEFLIPEDQLIQILGSIQQAIMDVLNIDMEQFTQQMDDLGIVNVDLLNPDTLRQLVLSANGKSDVTAFLADENLAKSVNELMESVDTILSDAGINLSEDELKVFADKLHNIIKQETLVMDDSVEKPVERQTRTEQASTTLIDNKATGATDMNSSIDEAIDIKAPNLVQSRGQEFSQTDQDDNNSNEMNPRNQFDGFIDQMINASQRTQQVDFIGNEMQITEFREIANQIIEQIKVTVLQEQSSMELQLNPENLGKVNLSVQSKDGVLTAQFIVNNDIVKEAIESQMIVLKDSLEQQGLRVETIEVTVANYSFDQRRESDSSGASNEQQQTRRKITVDEAIHMSELGQDEERVDNLSSELGNRIDYTA